jgi:hypothetical protein
VLHEDEVGIMVVEAFKRWSGLFVFVRMVIFYILSATDMQYQMRCDRTMRNDEWEGCKKKRSCPYEVFFRSFYGNKKHLEMNAAVIQIADPPSMKPLFPTLF